LKTQKRFAFYTAALLVIANCIGTGIFTTTGFLIADLKNPTVVFFVWCLGAAYALLGVRCYQKLHDLYPGSGGEYHFLKEGYHTAIGRFAGFVSLVAGFSAPIAASALGFALYLQKFSAYSLSPFVLASGLVLTVAGLQYFYENFFLKAHNLLVLGKLLGLFLIILVCSYFASWNPISFAEFQVSPRIVASSFFWCAYAFSGWNAVYYVAGEVLNENKQIHRASFWGTLGVVLLYLALNFVMLFSGQPELLQGQPEVVARYLEQIFSPSVTPWLSLLIAFGLVTTTSALFITGPRVYARMAADRALPRYFAVREGQTPHASLILQTALALLIIWAFDFDKILHHTGFVLTFCSALAASVLLKKTPYTRWAFWEALIFCVLSGGLIAVDVLSMA
jgi:APA family basic amino acid/polyamine antiporter